MRVTASLYKFVYSGNIICGYASSRLSVSGTKYGTVLGETSEKKEKALLTLSGSKSFLCFVEAFNTLLHTCQACMS